MSRMQQHGFMQPDFKSCRGPVEDLARALQEASGLTAARATAIAWKRAQAFERQIIAEQDEMRFAAQFGLLCLALDERAPTASAEEATELPMPTLELGLVKLIRHLRAQCAQVVAGWRDWFRCWQERIRDDAEWRYVTR